MPSKARALAELTRIHWFPVGCDFMFWPFAWGSLAASYHVALPMNEVVINTLFYALLGTLVHSAGCVINDMLDRDFDRKVERSKGRPIASGAVTMTEASILLFVLVAAIFYMFSTAGTTALTLGLVGLPACGGTYPLMKRWMYWPSLYLGFAASWAVPFTWVAITGQEGRREGWSQVHGGSSGRWHSFGIERIDVIFFACLLWAGYLNDQHLPFYVMSVIAPFLLCLWHIWSFDHNDPKDSWEKFTAGRHGAALVCAGLFVDHYFNLASLAI
ncbi:UbiA prenyltransferase family-domain-containing protein [Suillus subalutaceus]|uniref:UbiA prenyltransferase family-domain-containing protein n=1 Tax=Suillus subalutaceus TaxID=48586 RepID=UPI001B86EEC7|nr:UbiA prenyltransferase family-domain-containing protein [Suillus subalutaceus]KAG1856001.1 UbiA prenyltransferase family-domain-containing protein [Suillus subalutaceus]